MRAVSALSTHPVVATALGETAGQVLEALPSPPALVLVAVTPPHLGTLEDVSAAIRALLSPEVVLGAVAPAVVGGGRHVEDGPALSLFALSGTRAAPLALEPGAGGGLERSGHLDGVTAAVVVADPFSCGAADLLSALGDVPAAGGLVGGARGPGGSRLLLDGEVRTSGAVGALLGGPAAVVASQGATPAGDAWVVTRSAADAVLELGGRPAAIRREQALGDDQQAAAIGLLLDERAEDADRSQLLAVPIVGTIGAGGLRVARTIPVGRVVRFLRMGPAEVEADLVAALAPFGPRPAGALIFPAEGRRGDADLVSDLLGCPLAGLGVSAPLAPVAGHLDLHGADASAMVLFP